MSKNNVSITLLCMDGSDIISICFIDGMEVGREILYQYTPYGDEFFFRKVVDLIINNKVKPDRWYIRYCILNDHSLALLAKVAAEKAAVYFEIPTYPYSGELTDEQLIVDIENQKKITPYVAGVFSPSCEDEDFFLGRKIIKTGNGVQFMDFKLNPTRKKIDNEFNLIGVAFLAFWHGYDRIIKSLKNFKIKVPNVRCCYYIVGEGPEKKELIRMAEEYDVMDMVKFCGPVDGDDLIELYNKAHCGVACLGLHRRQGREIKTEPLKVREFMAAGLPFILSYQDSIDFSNFPGVYRVSDDDAEVDLVNIFNQCKLFYMSDAGNTLQDFAKNNFDWGVLMKNQVDWIVNNR
ncbi:glycosyltransferase [Aeromonas schubertii]|uniref:Glycosyltransferase n=1 Tax=Aeromonas schubertii TaxID=652 RepID=A0ABS7VF88_9GAMM|nr:glycosyltransferase [Aeromonas schubertii]MBZ6068050.1 glycosyltransferase [Aeromonas schubertii]